jgi:YfiH family protein
MEEDLRWLKLDFPNCKESGTIPSAYLSLAKAGDMKLGRPLSRNVTEAVEEVFPGKQLYYGKQEHTRLVRIATGACEPGQIGDGFLTQDPRIVLGVTVADCLPIFLWDPQQNVRGLLHSGWKGTGILDEAIRLMQETFNTDPKELYVLFGPCIGVCCYSVPEERGKFFQKEFGKSSVQIRDGSGTGFGRSKQSLRTFESYDRISRSLHFLGLPIFSFRRQGQDSYNTNAGIILGVAGMNTFREVWKIILSKFWESMLKKRACPEIHKEQVIVIETPPKPELGDLAIPCSFAKYFVPLQRL